ncbi:MAG: 50S ribosomal protein L5 [Patescibacteria group bacterium]
MTQTLQQQYQKTILPALQKEFGIANVMAVPRIQKVVINTGIGRMVKDSGAIERVQRDMTVLSGQKPVIRKAKKSIASFKLREGMPVGVSVTLRGKRMYDFLHRLIALALPLSKDFRGVDMKNVDGAGNLNLGIKEHTIFPEVTYESVKDIFSLQVTIVTNAQNRERGIALLKQIGIPFK